MLDDEKCNFFGNVWVGDPSDASERGCYNLSLDQLRQKYSAVIFCNGALSDRSLGLQNESLKGILPARRVVNWYNGSLENDLQPGEFEVE